MEKYYNVYVFKCMVNGNESYLPIHLNYLLCDDEGDWIENYKEIAKKEILSNYCGLTEENTEVLNCIYFHEEKVELEE